MIAETLGSHPRVLVVEDEYYVADDVARCLEKLQLTVLGPAATLDEAWGLSASLGPDDAAVVDLNLRGESAIHLAEALLARDAKLFLCTGYDEGAFPESLRRVPRWQKPFSPMKLAEAVQEALNRRS